MGETCLNFMEKAFVGGSQSAKFMKVFSLESFLLYCNDFGWSWNDSCIIDIIIIIMTHAVSSNEGYSLRALS